jgi:glutathione synthase/RimK-type ligase-like ATP-grasp enzyme
MILVVSHAEDQHVDDVMERLHAMGAEAALADMAEFPSTASMTLAIQGESPAERTLACRAGTVDLNDVRVIWWRRVRQHVVATAVENTSERLYAARETAVALGGLLDGIGCNWVNPWAADEAAHRKPFQWLIARSVGFNVPASLVTNDPDRAVEFVRSLVPRPCVYKSLLASWDWRETRLVTSADLDRAPSVAYCPVIFQEYIDGIDLRVTVVGDRVYAASIDATGTSYPIDMRVWFDQACVEPAQLPADVERLCIEVVRRLGLVFGAIDLRATPSGDFYFLEINPAGLWLFVEHRTGLPISEAVADELARLDTANR